MRGPSKNTKMTPKSLSKISKACSIYMKFISEVKNNPSNENEWISEEKK